MQIKFQDFIPKLKQEGFFNSEYETLGETLEQVNEWIKNEEISVLNVETVVSPWDVNDANTNEYRLGTTVMDTSRRHQFIRVWYFID